MYADQGELRKATQSMGSRQLLANALGLSREFIDQCMRQEKKLNLKQALKTSKLCGWQIDICKLAPDYKETFDLMRDYLTYSLHSSKSLEAVSLRILPLPSIILGNSSCPIYPGTQDFSDQRNNPHFHRPLLIDADCHLINCACRFQAYQQWNCQTVGALCLNLSKVLKEDVLINDITKIFPLSELASVYQALKQAVGFRQGKRTDLQLVQDFGCLKPGLKTREVLAKLSGFNSYAHYKQIEEVLCRGIPALIQTMDATSLSVNRAQAIARLSPHEQRHYLETLNLYHY